MSSFASFEFVVGVAVGKIFMGAVLASSIFRNLALAAAAIGVCWLYAQGGTSVLLTRAFLLQADVLGRPDFSRGLVLGTGVAILAFGVVLRWRKG